jgi:hypothetical protein
MSWRLEWHGCFDQRRMTKKPPRSGALGPRERPRGVRGGAPAPPAAVYAPRPAGYARGLQRKSPILACLLSLMPEVGQIYVE